MNFSLAVLYTLEATAALTPLFYWQKVKANQFRWFAFYLSFIFLADISGYFINIEYKSKVTVLYYDYLVIPIEFMFMFWLFYKSYYTKPYKTAAIISACSYVICLALDIKYFSSFKYYFVSFSYSVGSLLLLILILLFFIKLATSDTILHFKSNVMFWISLGLLLFYLGGLPYYGLRMTFVVKHHDLNALYNKVVNVLNCLMYLMFTIAFIWGKPNSETSSS